MTSSLIAIPAREWKRQAGWLTPDNSTPLGRNIVERAFRDVGILEVPLGSNRGVRIDEYLRRAGVPESLITSGKGWWCAAWAGAMFADAGAKVPRDYASCDSWLPFVQPEPMIGAAILYGVRGNAHHIGIVVRLDTDVLTIEGNRAFAGTASNNGVAVELGPLARRDVLGYIHPQAVGA
jgi:hypothetical protein